MRAPVWCLTTLVAVLWIWTPVNAGEIWSWGELNPPPGNDFVKVDGGMYHGLALRSDGTLVNFGSSLYWGGTTPPGSGYKDIACGWDFDVAIKADGSLIAWGRDYEQEIYHQLDVPSGNDFVAVAARGRFGLALRSNGTLAAWGDNTHGQGNVPAGAYKAIACGCDHGIALTTGSKVACWGSNVEGQLGANNWSALDIGSAQATTYIVRTSGYLRAFGQNLAGEGTVAPGGGFVEVVGDYMHGVALRGDGTLATWGMNYYGAVSPYPSGGDFISLGAGEHEGYAIRFQPVSLLRGSAACTGDLDGFVTGGYSSSGLDGAIPLACTVDVDNLVLDGGMATLVVDYDPDGVAAQGLSEDSLRLYRWDEGSSAWLLAGRNSNMDQSTGQFVAGAPTGDVGDWGVDTADDSVWANIDHASTYGLAGEPIPEPATNTLLSLGVLAILRRRRRR